MTSLTLNHEDVHGAAVLTTRVVQHNAHRVGDDHERVGSRDLTVGPDRRIGPLEHVVERVWTLAIHTLSSDIS